MIIKKIAFGDRSEAFIEDRLSDGLNVIYSDDNNRGKTLVMQGLMYSLGYDSIFPSSFNYKDKYFYSEIIINDVSLKFLRKKNSVIIKSNDSIQIFNSISEMRYFMDRFIIKLPKILKDGRPTTVDPSLLYELFFVGQDGRNPSGLISRGQFNKLDFKNMVYDLAGIPNSDFDVEEITSVKDTISSLKIKLIETKKKISIIKDNPDIAEFTSKIYDADKTQEKIRKLDDIHERISLTKRTRQREINRRLKLVQLISELNSLNIDLSEGTVACGDCKSTNIVYSNTDFTFEISNTDVRSEIMKSIKENISQKDEMIHEYTEEINALQDKLNIELSDTPPSFQSIILYMDQITSQKDYDQESLAISKQIQYLNSRLKSSQLRDEKSKNSRYNLDNNLIKEMNRLYKQIDPNGNIVFDDIFTKRDSTFSGSEGQEFYFCKLISLSNLLNHDFPIIVDSFRDGELSTNKEDSMLKIYRTLGKQVILTSTLKEEEYKNNKYKNKEINSIDYSNHEDCKILSSNYKEKFIEIISSFDGITI